MRLHLAQVGAPYRVTLPVKIELPHGQSFVTSFRLDVAEQVVSLLVPARPVSLEVDPGFDAFRRLDQREIPPMLNRFLTDTQRSVLLPTHGTELELQPYQELAMRLLAQDQQKTVSVKADSDLRPPGSVLVLGGPDVNGAADWAVSGCRDDLSLAKKGVTIEGHTYQGANMAFLMSCSHPEQPDRVVTLFYGMSPSAAAKGSRLLFFYGWQSYLVFQDGTVIARGNFSPAQHNLQVIF